MPLMRKPERKLGELVDTWHPDAVVATYPLYPYFLERLLAGPPPPCARCCCWPSSWPTAAAAG